MSANDAALEEHELLWFGCEDGAASECVDSRTCTKGCVAVRDVIAKGGEMEG